MTKKEMGDVMQVATCGTLESNDCFVTVMPNQNGRKIEIDSIVLALFGDQIKRVIDTLLDEMQCKNIAVHVQDKGALDYTIQARLRTAIQRAGAWL